MTRRPITDQSGRRWTWHKGMGWVPDDRPIFRKKKRRGGKRHRKKERLWFAFEGLCGICGRSIDDPYSLTEDHVVPRYRGGDDYWNIVPSHHKCNSQKGSRLPTACELLVLEVVNLRLKEPDDAELKYGPHSSLYRSARRKSVHRQPEVS